MRDGDAVADWRKGWLDDRVAAVGRSEAEVREELKRERRRRVENVRSAKPRELLGRRTKEAVQLRRQGRGKKEES